MTTAPGRGGDRTRADGAPTGPVRPPDHNPRPDRDRQPDRGDSIGTGQAGPVAAATTRLIRGSAFCLSDRAGDIVAGDTHGLYVRDTRVLSDWALMLDGQPVEPLTVVTRTASEAEFIARGTPAADTSDSAVAVFRRRTIAEGMVETLRVCNYAQTPVSLVVDVIAAADLADLFEVKDRRVRSKAARREVLRDSTIRISRGLHGVTVNARPAAEPGEQSLRWRITIPAGAQWSATLRVTPIVDGQPLAIPAPRLRPRQPSVAPRVLTTPDRALAAIIDRSIQDLQTLRIGDPRTPGRTVVAAGAPWYMALFGRDSLLTAWMMLPVDPMLAVDTLHVLAGYQGHLTDAASEEQPGRIPHEVRFGPAAPVAFGQRHAYYGTADATPLFVALLGELRRWGHDGPSVRALLPAADRALAWIDGDGDPDGDGFVEYPGRRGAGLLNQGWKDSAEGINHADGTPAAGPIALAEVQGYVYAAQIARAEIARDVGDEETSRYWRARAAALKEEFNRAYWLPDRGWFAVGLDGDKKPIDALTSNPGHCLWTGIVDADKAAVMADRLMDDDVFTGWGIRTLASSMGAYNPMSYHNGSVWPHDTAICAAGLMRYGHHREASRIARGLLGAATHLGSQMPELFCGFARDDFAEPIPYPVACSPQAWSAAAPLLVLRTLLGLDPDLTTGRLWLEPHLPESALPLTAHTIAIGSRTVTISVTGDGVDVDGLDDAVTVLRSRRA